MVTFDASEVRRLADDLGDARRDLPDNARRTVRVNAIRMADYQRWTVPVLSGDTWRSIGNPDYDADGLGAEVGPGTSYAPFIERGTSRMRPQPFVGPSAVYIERPFYGDCADLTDVFGPGR